MSDGRVVVLGCGYVGTRLARRLAQDGFEVRGTTRDESRFPEISATGAEPARVDVMRPETLAPVAEWEPDAVFDLVRPQRIGIDRYTTWGTRNVISVLGPAVRQAIVYVSSTSVYGRRDAGWTDEETETAPSSPLGLARVESEALYLDACRESELPARICRVPGIYGPGRTLRQRLETGAYRRLDEPKRWVSRIHVDDLVEGLIAAWRRGHPGRVYLLCDDEPVTGEEYAELTASLLALPLPPTVDREDIRGELSSSAFERRLADRRCRNRRMREELGVRPRYPSVREGLPSALRAEGAL